MEKAEISWFLTIWLFLPRLAFFGHGLAFFLKRCLATLLRDRNATMTSGFGGSSFMDLLM